MKELVEQLIENKKTISTMESCTGGGLANAITNIPGASEVVKFCAVTYSNEFKVKMGVSSEVIDKYSVYSRETADEMSKKISDFTLSSYGVGITGKLKRSDINNMYGEDDLVHISIYDRENDKYYNTSVIAIYDERPDNKELVIEEVVKTLLMVMKNTKETNLKNNIKKKQLKNRSQI